MNHNTVADLVVFALYIYISRRVHATNLEDGSHAPAQGVGVDLGGVGLGITLRTVLRLMRR